MAGEIRHDPKIEQALKTHKELAKGTRAAFDKADQARRTDLRGRLRGMLSRIRRSGQPSAETARPRMENLTEAERARLRQEFGGQRPGESYAETDRRYDGAARKVVAERGSSQTPGPLPSNETAQRIVGRYDGEGLGPVPKDIRTKPPRMEFNLRAHHELSQSGRRYFDQAAEPETATDDTAKPSEE